MYAHTHIISLSLSLSPPFSVLHTRTCANAHTQTNTHTHSVLHKPSTTFTPVLPTLRVYTHKNIYIRTLPLAFALSFSHRHAHTHTHTHSRTRSVLREPSTKFTTLPPIQSRETAHRYQYVLQYVAVCCGLL